jgi:uncharacterized protein YdhG (YjbR/CyaY superfamily)
VSVVDSYLSELPAGQRKELERIRAIVRKYYPEAREAISYGMPSYKFNGKYLIAYWGFKDHMSVFPGARSVEVLQDKLSKYTTSKGTVQFTLKTPLPESLIAEMLQLRVADIVKG